MDNYTSVDWFEFDIKGGKEWTLKSTTYKGHQIGEALKQQNFLWNEFKLPTRIRCLKAWSNGSDGNVYEYQRYCKGEVNE